MVYTLRNIRALFYKFRAFFWGSGAFVLSAGISVR